jgi:FkbM family methyltransferase
MRRLRDFRRAWLPNIPGTRLRDHPRLLALFERVLSASQCTYLDDVDGHRMHLNPINGWALAFQGIHEPQETRTLDALVKPGDVVLDLGASIGYFTLRFARSVGPAGRVIAVEPDPLNFELLSRNVALNGYENVTLLNKAAALETGPLRLFLSDDNAGDHRTSGTPDSRASVEVQGTRLDEELADVSRLDFVKIDIQGAEVDALCGLRQLLARSPGVSMLVEFWPSGLANAGVEPRRLLDLLDELGFRVEDITGGPSDAPSLLRAYPIAGGRHTNLVATHRAPRAGGQEECSP